MQSYALFGLLAASSAVALPNRHSWDASGRDLTNVTQPLQYNTTMNDTMPSNSTSGFRRRGQGVVPFIPGLFNSSMPFNCTTMANCTASMMSMGTPEPQRRGLPMGDDFINEALDTPSMPGLNLTMPFNMTGMNDTMQPMGQMMSARQSPVNYTMPDAPSNGTHTRYNGTRDDCYYNMTSAQGHNSTEDPFYIPSNCSVRHDRPMNFTAPMNFTGPMNFTNPYQNDTENTNGTDSRQQAEHAMDLTQLLALFHGNEKRAPQGMPSVNSPTTSLASSSSGNDLSLSGLSISKRSQVEQIAREMVEQIARALGATSLDADDAALYADMSPSEIDAVSNLNVANALDNTPATPNVAQSAPVSGQ